MKKTLVRLIALFTLSGLAVGCSKEKKEDKPSKEIVGEVLKGTWDITRAEYNYYNEQGKKDPRSNIIDPNSSSYIPGKIAFVSDSEYVHFRVDQPQYGSIQLQDFIPKMGKWSVTEDKQYLVFPVFGPTSNIVNLAAIEFSSKKVRFKYTYDNSRGGVKETAEVIVVLEK